MDYEYFVTSVANGVLTVDDCGNCAIDLYNDNGMEKILVIDTSLGATRIFTFGPFNPDLDRLPNICSTTFKQINYSIQAISKEINKFLNDYKFGGTQAIEIDKEEALSKCRNIIDYMRSNIY